MRRALSYRAGLGVLLTPFLVGSAVLVAAPLVVTAVLAFTRYDALSSPTWAGTGNFVGLLDDPEMHASLRATGWFVLLVVPARVIGSAALALLMHRRERLSSTGRIAVFLPAVVPDVATSLVWLWLINPLYGPLAAVARLAGFTPGAVLHDKWGARLVIAAVASLALGEGFLVALAARREAPERMYEVARAEGARPFTVLRRVTLPLLAPTLALLAARDLVASLQASVAPTLLLTGGGPRRGTLTLPVFAYERGFEELRLGDSAALALLLFVTTTAFALLQLRLVRRWTAR
ncbi:MAG TPA: sugar ABC transporter permease [Mycobacteriales bacterium]|nr:sugar ABC transporter permease [Mycobacteriales bacterium]